MGQPPIKKRTYGYQLSGCERTLIFEKEDIGYVRYRDARRSIFYLDPSPFLETVEKVDYFVKAGSKPPKGQLIEVIVTETEPYYEIVNGYPEKRLIKYIIGWQEVDPNTIRGNKNLSKEDYLDNLVLPIKQDVYDIEDIAICLGLYTVACPPLNDIDQGGINTLIQTKFNDNEKRIVFDRIVNVVPSELRRVNARNFYKTLDTSIAPFSDSSLEVSLAWFNIPKIIAHIPLNFDYNFKSYSEYKENLEFSLPMQRAFMIDALLFNPKISDDYIKTFDEAMYEIREIAWTLVGDIPFTFNFTDAAPRIAMALARLGFREKVTKDDIRGSVDHWGEAVTRASLSQGAARDFRGDPNQKGYYDRSPEEKRLLAEIYGLRNEGTPLTIENLRSRTAVPSHMFETTLDKLRAAGYIYLPGEGRIRVLED